MALSFRLRSSAPRLKFNADGLTAYLVPDTSNKLRFVELSGSGLLVPYNVDQTGRITDNPPQWSCNGAGSIATTPTLAANRPPNFTIQLFAKVTNTPGAYAFGAKLGGDTFFRTATGDLRSYIIATDGSGNFLISSDQTPALGSWHLFSITAAPNDCRFFIDGVQVANIAKTARADANFALKYNWSSGAHVLGVSVLYIGKTLTPLEVSQNYNYLKARHGY